MLSKIIDYLVEQYEGKDTLPFTADDAKVSANKEGMIGQVLSGIMYKIFRRYNDTLAVFVDGRYHVLMHEDVPRLVYGWMMKVGVGPAYLARSVSGVTKMILNNPYLRKLNARRDVVYMRNCVLLISPDGGVAQVGFDPKYESLIHFDFDYEPTAECPNWERFLNTVIEDVKAVRVMQEFLGCIFIDKDVLSIEKALFLYGTGSNGKSVVFETLNKMMGGNMVSIGLSQVNGNTGDYFTAEMVGKLLAYNSDAEAKDISSGKYKQLISKERTMVRRIRESPFESDDWPMFMANINKGLITTDSSDGFWRRNIVIGFNKTFSDNPDPRLGQLKADKSFKYSILGETSGIFNWILEGRKRIIEQKGVFTRSKSIDLVLEDMRSHSTSVYSFLRDNGYSATQPQTGKYEFKRVHSKDLYKEYCDWCAENGYRDLKNINRFRDDMLNEKITWSRCVRVGAKVSSGFMFYYQDKIHQEPGEGDELWDDYDDLPY